MHYIITIGASDAMQMIHYILTVIIIDIIIIIIIIIINISRFEIEDSYQKNYYLKIVIIHNNNYDNILI